MNLLDILRSLARRWYIVVPGIILAVAGAAGAWVLVAPAYERSASQLLLPGQGTLPEGASNPYLYLGGLTAPADVLVRAVASEDSLRPILEQYPDAQIEIARDPSASGPVIFTKVSAPSDADAATIIDILLEKTTTTLDTLQSGEGIPTRDRITITTIAVDDEGVVQQRDRLVATAGVGMVLLLFALIVASVIDGLAKRSGRHKRQTDAARTDVADDDVSFSDSEPHVDVDADLAETRDGVEDDIDVANDNDRVAPVTVDALLERRS